MKIDIIRLIYDQVKEILINDIVIFDIKKYNHQSIIELEPLKLNGVVVKNSQGEIILKLNCRGIMILPDSKTNENIPMDFEFNINEIIDESVHIIKNILDIEGILWENIVLEVPISISKSKKTNLEKGEGWELK